MARFQGVQELQTYLEQLSIDFGAYASGLWGHGVREARHLADADVDDLLAAGVQHRLHARGIIKGASGTTAGAGVAAGADAMDRLTRKLDEVVELLVVQKEAVQGQKDLMTQLGHFMADHSNGTIDASNVTAAEVDQIDQAMQIVRIPNNGGDVSMLQGDSLRYEWVPDGNGHIREDSKEQAENVQAFLNDNLNKDGVIGFDFLNINRAPAAAFPKASFSGVARQFRARGDYLVVENRYGHMTDPVMQRKVCLVGVEVKTELKVAHLAQARLGHLVYGSHANAAILYVLTDLQHGGVLFWAATREEDGRLQVFEEAVNGMKELFSRVRGALLTVPRNVGAMGTTSRPRAPTGVKLEQPYREKFYVRDLQNPAVEPAQLLQDAWQKCLELSDDEQDLRAWYPDGGSENPMQHAYV